MAEIIPAILAKSEEEFKAKVAQIGDLAVTIQIDVMDGVFVENTTWADPKKISAMNLPYILDVHLMVADPLKAVRQWIEAEADRIVVHAEAAGWHQAVKEISGADIEAGVAINPDTSVKEIEDAMNDLSVILVMGVTPGWSGQEFQLIAIDKVRQLREQHPGLRLEVDGGVSLDTAGELARAGATGLVTASALFNEKSFEENFKTLSQAAAA